MWTFLGIASFTYLYKKSNTVLTTMNKEIVVGVTLVLTVALLLAHVRYFDGEKLRLSRAFKSFLSFLSLLPVINHLMPQASTQRSKEAEKSREKVRIDRISS